MFTPQPGSSAETERPSSSHTKRKPAVTAKHTGGNESDTSDESGQEDGASDNPSDGKVYHDLGPARVLIPLHIIVEPEGAFLHFVDNIVAVGLF